MRGFRGMASRRPAWLLAGALMAAGIAGCGGAASSGGSSGATAPAPASAAAAHPSALAHGPHFGQGRRLGMAPLAATLSPVLKLPASTIAQDLEHGESLAQIAKQQGVSTQALTQALEQHQKTVLDNLVKAGRLTEAEAQQRLQQFEQRIPQLINHAGGFFPPRMPPSGAPATPSPGQ